jgi:putative oxidoreductase
MQPTDFGLLILRLVVGLTLAGHGAQKAFGWWNGPGIERWRDAIGRMGGLLGGLVALGASRVMHPAGAARA